MKALLKSQHITISEVNVEELYELCCMAGNPNAEDLIKVYTQDGQVLWCDEIEFVK